MNLKRVAHDSIRDGVSPDTHEPPLKQHRRAEEKNAQQREAQSGDGQHSEAVPCTDAHLDKKISAFAAKNPYSRCTGKQLRRSWTESDFISQPVGAYGFKDAVASTLPVGWQVQIDEESGAPFYWLEGRSDETTWDHPALQEDFHEEPKRDLPCPAAI